MGRKSAAHGGLSGLAVAAALVLAGCSGGGNDLAETTTPTAESSVTSTPAGPGDENSDEPSESGEPSESTDDSGEGSAPGEATGASGEDSTSSSGAYKPASAEGPAENVPVPERPVNARGDSERAALVTAKFFWDTVHYLEMTGDGGPTRAVSSGDCSACAAFVGQYGDVYESGDWIAAEAPDVRAATAVSRDSSGTRVDVHQLVDFPASTQFTDPPGSSEVNEVAAVESQPMTVHLRLDEGEGVWEVIGLSTGESQG
ncbi:MAG: DUF6318 family protein [Micrococcus sp.]|nr:DUF6318 family protein [Micrococcus sp.]